MPEKPLGRKAYGSIGHLPHSRLGPGDHCLNEGQTRILTEQTRDKHDLIIVQEKLDGSSCAVANIDGEIIALTRKGYRAVDSLYLMHHYFAEWVEREKNRFAFLQPGERVNGEWVMQAHGTRYRFPEDEAPFFVFDLFRNDTRVLYLELKERVSPYCQLPYCLHVGAAYSVDSMRRDLGDYGYHNAIDYAEGAVWRVERMGKVDFLGKFVRPDKVDGKYLMREECGVTVQLPPVWLWQL